MNVIGNPVQPCRFGHGLLLYMLLNVAALANPTLVTDPGNPGPDLPAVGRSLFDTLTIADGRQQLPFPFDALIRQLAGRQDDHAAAAVRSVLIPHGRSLQRNAAAPQFFTSPRMVVAFDEQPALKARDWPAPLVKDRLYVAYMPAADALEIISYNEAAGRFEFQLVSDYREGGRAETVYARRVVCVACHQNHAPIFARPLWDETNANPAIAARLAERAPDATRALIKQGVDIAYAIDNSTDRANDFALTQKLWTQGCGTGSAGRSCRARLLLAAMQFRLSGKRGFEVDPELSSHMQAMRMQYWPGGLLRVSGDIPNRRPDRILESPVIDAQTAQTEAADIEAASDPLQQRPVSIWDPNTDDWIKQAVAGITAFLTDADLQMLLDAIPSAAVSGRSLRADCKLTQPLATALRTRITCEQPTIQVDGLLYRDAAGQNWRGRLSRLNIAGNELGAVSIVSRPVADNHLFGIERVGGPADLYLVDGTAISHASLQMTANPAGENAAAVELSLHLDDRFSLLRNAIAMLAAQADTALEARPFPRRLLLSRLSSIVTGARAADDDIASCCEHAGLPTPRTTAAEPALAADPLLDPFVRTCGACHRSSERFPPNFLSGDVEQVRRAIGQCAERIRYRLAMWDIPAALRAKTPMPPDTRHPDVEALASWRDGLLHELRQALALLVEQSGQELATLAELTRRPYAELRQCFASA